MASSESSPRGLRAEETEGWWDQLGAGCDVHAGLMGWMLAASAVSLALVLAALPVVVARLPADYLDPARPAPAPPRAAGRWAARALRNALGVVFLVVGVALLVLPGQGLLTMLIGLMMVDFPGKRRLERRILTRPAILRAVNRVRERRGQAPLKVS